MTSVPPEAIEVACRVFAEGGGVADAVTAAAPFIRAEEREAIISLAERQGAVCTGDEGTSCYFADILRSQR